MDIPVTLNFSRTLMQYDRHPLRRAALSELQVNLGYLCNQACEHCHVEAGPKRTEMMTRETMQKIVKWAKTHGIQSADLTGGAPELIPHYREFTDALLACGIQVTSRCNLTVIFEPNQTDLPEWFAARKIRLVCSLPCYSAANVDRQRGKGVFDKSIRALQLLNQHGYAHDADLILDLVYNPVGAQLPPPQEGLCADYKESLQRDFGVAFNNLLTITNLPIKRFKRFLKNIGQLQSYQQMLADNFNAGTLDALMCRHLISVDWRGYVYDCDFNQMEDLPLSLGRKKLWELTPQQLRDAPVATGAHCFGCTAGAGSSCGGALT